MHSRNQGVGSDQGGRMNEERTLAGKQKVVIGTRAEPEKSARAKAFRAKPTATEAILWSRLRTNQLHGFHFRRQQVISGFIVDFYCHSVRLVVEIDGAIHLEQRSSDEERDRALRGLGLDVLRVQARDVHQRLSVVLTQIAEACQAHATRT